MIFRIIVKWHLFRLSKIVASYQQQDKIQELDFELCREMAARVCLICDISVLEKPLSSQ